MCWDMSWSWLCLCGYLSPPAMPFYPDAVRDDVACQRVCLGTAGDRHVLSAVVFDAAFGCGRGGDPLCGEVCAGTLCSGGGDGKREGSGGCGGGRVSVDHGQGHAAFPPAAPALCRRTAAIPPAMDAAVVAVTPPSRAAAARAAGVARTLAPRRLPPR